MRTKIITGLGEKSSYALFALALAAAGHACGGCSRGPATVYAPSINATSAADKALSLYDSDGDGSLDEQELTRCPGILNAMGTYDIDGDRKVSRKELADRIASWASSGPAMLSVDCRVMYDGRPLEGAAVRFVPEPYLEGSLKPASGVTRENGIAAISLAEEDMPPQLKRIKAMNAGTYKVEITHPSKKIPPRYNEQTTLGREISKQTAVSPFDDFQLSSK